MAVMVPGHRASQGQDELGGELGVCTAPYPVGAEPGSGHRPYRFEYWGALRAFLSPYFLDSFSRESRVRMPAFLRVPRSSGSSSHRALAIPRRNAPAWPETPPPSSVMSMSYDSVVSARRRGSVMIIRWVAEEKYSLTRGG